MARSKAKKLTRGKQGWITRRANLAAAKAKAIEAQGVWDNQVSAGQSRIGVAGQVAQNWTTSGLAAAIGGQVQQMGAQEIPAAQSEDDKLGLAIVEAARKREGVEHVNRLLQIERQKARADGIANERERQNRLVLVRSRCTDERIVCGFVAEVKEMERSYGSLPYELIWSMNSLTLTKVVEALLRAGYRPEGRVAAPAE